MSKLTQDKEQLDLDLAAHRITREQYERALINPHSGKTKNTNS